MWKSLVRAINALLYLAPLSLFVYGTRFLFPLATLKIHGFYIIVDLLVLLWALTLIRGGAFSPRLNHPLIKALALFLGVLTVAAGFGLDPIQSLFSTPARTIGVVGLWHFFAFALALTTFLDTAEKRMRYLRFILIVASLVALSGVIQSFAPGFLFGGATDRHGGFLDNPIFLAGYLLSYLFLGAYALHTKRLASYALLTVCSLIVLGGFWVANTRGAILGLIAGGVVTVLVYLVGRKKEKAAPQEQSPRRYVVIGAVVLALLIFLATGPLARLTDFSFAQASIANRLTSWHNAWRSFTEYPLLGVGPENFRFVADRYFDPLVIKSSETERYFDKPHSVPLEILSTAGALGFLAYLYLLITLVRVILKSGLDNKARAYACGALAAWLVQGLFSFESFGTYLSLFVAIGLLAGVKEEKEPATTPTLSIQATFVMAALLACSALVWNVASINKGRTIFLLPQTTSAEVFARQAEEKLSTRPHHAGNTIALNQYYGMLKDALLQGVPGSEQILTVLESWTTDKEPANLTSLGLSYFILFAQSNYEETAYAMKAEEALNKARLLRPRDERTLRGLYCLYYTTSDSRAPELREQLKALFPALTDEAVCLL